MDIPQTALGGIPSVDDYRDHIVTASFAPLASVSLPNVFQSTLAQPVMMQSQEPACVAHDITDLIKLWWFRQHGEWVDFSPRFLDILSAEPDIPLDGGRRPRTVLKIAVKQGICTTATLPNDTNLPIAQYRDKLAITPAAYAEAQKYVIPGYFRVAMDLQSTRAAIFRYGAVTTLMQIGKEMYTAANGTTSWAEADIVPLRTPAVVISGHQMGQKGWQDDKFNTLRNEWSSAWARQGENDIDYNAWLPFIYEQWAIAQIPQNISDFLQHLPSPTDFHYAWSTDMKRGDNSIDVKFAQVALMILGYMTAVSPDELGIYGPKTSAAVLKYQTAKGISPTAPDSIGPKTRAALNAQFAI